MRSVQLVRLGEPLQDAEVAIPEIAPSDVLVRVAACGICHSDAHYRAGISPIRSLPVALGHEVAGRIEAVGKSVHHVAPGDRVCIHYLVSCGSCNFCSRGDEQFCATAQMIGKHRDGGFADFITVPGRNAFLLPDEIPFEVGAIMMCSSATALHALNKARLQPGESLAIFGFGGLGFSALQLAKALGSGKVFVVEINPAKLALATAHGAIAIDPTASDPVGQIEKVTHNKGVDVSLELVGSATTMAQAAKCVGARGRAALVGLTTQSLSLFPYADLINKEAEIVGVSDHLASELPLLIELVRSRKLQFPYGTIRLVDLEAGEINSALDAVEKSTKHIRTVIVPAANRN